MTVGDDVVRVVSAVAAHLETPEEANRIRLLVEQVRDQHPADWETSVRQLFADIGRTSNTARVFSVIHQNLIFVGIYHLKTKLPITTMSRVRWALALSF